MRAGGRIWKLAYAVILTVLTVLVVGSFLRVGVNRFPRAMFPDMVQGTAHKPFVYRALVPFVVRHVSASVPQGVRDGIDRHVRAPLLESIDRAKMRLKLGTVDWTELLVCVLVWYLSVIGFAWVFKKLARSLYKIDEGFLDVFVLAAVAGLPVFFRYYSYLYDFTHLFLFTACLVALSRSSWPGYLLLFVITTFSKETTILLIGIFAVAYQRVLPRRSFATLLAVQVVAFVAVKGLLELWFGANPGGFVRLHLLDHNLWLEPYSIGQFLGLALLAIAIARDWGKKPLFLRQCFLIIVPALLFLTLFLGFLDEYRDYYEAYPVVLLLVAPGVSRLLGLPPVQSRQGLP